jgi:outer membrane protein OmpU
VQASGGVLYYPRSKQQPVGNNGSDVFAWNAGAQVAIGGFSFGGAYLLSPNKDTVQASVINLNGVAGQNVYYSLGGYCWSVGTAYEFGPYKIGLGYVYGFSNGVTSATGPMATHLGDDQILKQAALSGTWTMGPGIRLVGGVFAYDLQTDTPGVTGYNNQGIGAATGLKLSF